ncbi:hypothetical protein VCHA48O428_20308 [Vibrio chagasii]|nr:hypothetical protein VCHA48O428_20308 [Vibrio chagasii]
MRKVQRVKLQVYEASGHFRVGESANLGIYVLLRVRRIAP